MSKTMNIGIDHGYYAIKTRHFSFPAGIAEYSHEPYTLQNTLEFGGKFYVCGTGRQPILRNKMENDNYYLLTLAAIAKEIKQRGGKTECSVRIAAGLPLAGFGREKKPFREYLLRSSQPVCFKFEGIAYKITIEDVKLFPQGYSAIALHSELIQNEPSVLLMDIGGWTVDLMRLDNGVPNAATCRSLELGMIRCIDETKEQVRRDSKRKVSCRRTKSGRGKYTSKYALSERTVCGECGAMYRRTMWIKRDRTKEDVWRCVNRLEFGTKYCKHSPSLKEPILHQAILNCIQSVFHNKEEIAEAVREAQKKIILFEDAKNNPEVIRQRMQDIDHGMANLLTLAAQSSQIELFEKKFKEMTEEKARLTEQLKQAEEDATTDAKRQKQLDDILKAIDIDIVELTEFDDTFIRRIVEQVTILSKDKIEVRFIGGFSKVGDIPTK